MTLRLRGDKKLPPIQGVPMPAPKCLGCERRLKPRASMLYQRVESVGGTGFTTEIVGRYFDGWHAYSGLFHSLRCALFYATQRALLTESERVRAQFIEEDSAVAVARKLYKLDADKFPAVTK